MRRRRPDQPDPPQVGSLEVFDVRVVDEPPPSQAGPVPSPAPAPWTCRWHLWHRWALVRVDAHTTYVACAACGRLPAPTVFETPVP